MDSREARIQTRIHEIGSELFTAVQHHEPRPGTRAWLHDQGMAWSMTDREVQVHLFRFIDALPGLRSSDAIATHLVEFLAPVAHRLPWLAQRLLAAVPMAPTGVIAAAVHRGARELAGRFLLGADSASIAKALQRLHGQGLCFTIDWLGEAVLTEAEADAYQQAYLRLIPDLTAATAAWSAVAASNSAVPPVNVSIKLSALTSRFEPADVAGTSRRVCERLRPILRLAQRHGALVNIDMEHHAYRDATMRIFTEVLDETEFRAWSNVGIAIQAYLLSSGQDLADLAAWARRRGTPVWVRLVKGAYWDYEQAYAAQRDWTSPVFSNKATTDANFETQTRFLLHQRQWLRPAIAGHNVRSLAHAMAWREELGLPQDAVEFQLLQGMADPLKRALAERGERVRVYCPVGELLPGIAYLVRRLLENTSNQGFVRAGFFEHRSPSELLMAPVSRVESFTNTSSELGSFSNHPPADFSRPDHRDAMRSALASMQEERCPLVINGSQIFRDQQLVSRDPSQRERIVGRASAATAADAHAAMEAAARALPRWRDTPWSERIACLERAADRLATARWELSALLVREVGKSWREADGEVCELIDFCRYYAQHAGKLAAGIVVDVPGETNDSLYDPRGVSVVIAPWNFPLAILGGMTVAALVTGNPVVMKPAEQAPVIAYSLYRHLLAAGIPASVLQYLPGDGEVVGPALVNHPATAVIAFTGSRAVGLGLNRQATQILNERHQVVRVIAEMGGKNAIIIDSSADLDEAVSGVVASAFGYQGQKCSACSRVIVHLDVYELFNHRLIEAVRALQLGPAEHAGHFIGPVIDDESRLRLEQQLAELRTTQRCAIALDASALTDVGSYVGPHVFIDVDPTSPLAQEELFGPVLAVIPAADLDAALHIANGTRYALTGGCFARSPAVLERVRKEFRVGNLYLNRGITGALVHRQPFGGFKLSGIGSKAGGPDYLLQFTLPRTVTENTLRHGMVGDRESSTAIRGLST